MFNATQRSDELFADFDVRSVPAENSWTCRFPSILSRKIGSPTFASIIVAH